MIEADPDDVANALSRIGALEPGGEANRDRVQEVLGEMIRDWSVAFNVADPV
jgi:hypothetical protein